MNHNLQTAISAIQAEVINAKEGLAFYEARVIALEKALLEIANVGTSAIENTPAPVKPAAPATKFPARSSRKKKEPKRPKRQTAGLPSTGGDYWVNLVTTEPQSNKDILNRAIAQLGLAPTDAQVRMLAARQTIALNALVKAKTIKDVGIRRERRFFK